MTLAYVGDPISYVLDGKLIGLALVSVVLFIGSSILQYLINDKLGAIKTTNASIEDGIVTILSNQKKLQESSDRLSGESHEQWTKINETNNLVRENHMRIQDMSKDVDTVLGHQATLASAQVNSNQNTQKVIEQLISVLQDHTRE